MFLVSYAVVSFCHFSTNEVIADKGQRCQTCLWHCANHTNGENSKCAR